MHDVCDLRSDTATRPSDEMRRVIMEAPVGDAVFNEDPTVRRLEEEVADHLGKEAALYVASGTMANVLAIRLCAQPGDEVLTEASAHPILFEAGGSSAFSGVLFKTISGTRGLMTAGQVEEKLYEPVYYRPRQRAVLLENTHNRGGGTIYPLATIEAICEVARARGLRVHMDGARLWNASVAADIPMREYAACVDTLSVCFSKALGAPVGSALAGSREDMEMARRYRHMLGGSWRQAGVLAAAALYAMEHHVGGLATDHANARLLAGGIEACGLRIVNRVETNMLYFELPESQRRLSEMASRGVLMAEIAPGTVRCVTHRDVDRDDVARAVEVLGGVL